MSEIRCSNCSTINRAGAAFCRNCGTKLPDQEPAGIQPGQVPQTVMTDPAPELENQAGIPPIRPPAPAAQPAPPATPPARKASPAAQAPHPAPRPPAPPASRSWWTTSANLAAVVLGITFVFLISFALPVLNVGGDLLDGEQYKASLREQDVYARFPDLFAEQMQRSQAALGEQAHIDFTGITAADWRLIATELVTPQWMQTQVESLIDQTFATAEQGSSTPDLNISLAEVGQRLGSDSGFNIYKQIIATKRKCSLDDFFDIIDWISQAGGVNLPICDIPPTLTEFAAFLAGYENGDELIRDLLKELPDQIPSEVSLSDFFTLRMDRAANWIKMVTVLSWICLILALAAIVGTLISPFVRSIKGWLLVWGICLVIAGVVSLVSSQALPFTLGGLVVGAFSSSIAPSIARIILETGRNVTQAGADALFWQALAMLLLGLAMAGAGAVVWVIQKNRS